LRDLLNQSVEFAGGGLIELGLFLQAKDADGFEDAQGAHTVGVGGIFGGLEADRHVAHGAEVVDFVRLGLLDDTDQVGGVGEVAVVQDEVLVFDVRVLVEVVDSVGIERRCAALDTVDFIAFFNRNSAR
jgi:hypothetical protein